MGGMIACNLPLGGRFGFALEQAEQPQKSVYEALNAFDRRA